MTGALRGLAYLALLTASCLAVMALSYALVRHAAGRRAPEPPGDAARREATLLREYSNELLALTAEFLEKAEHASSPSDETFAVWIDERFSPRVNDLRRRLMAPEVTGPAFSPLIAAAGKVSAMAAQPGQVPLRQEVAQLVVEAAETAEERIQRLGMTRALSRPPERAGF